MLSEKHTQLCHQALKKNKKISRKIANSLDFFSEIWYNVFVAVSWHLRRAKLCLSRLQTTMERNI